MKTEWSSRQGRHTQRVSARRPSAPGTQCPSRLCQRLGKEEGQLVRSVLRTPGTQPGSSPSSRWQHSTPILGGRPPCRPQPFIDRGPSRLPMETAPLHAGKPLPWPHPPSAPQQAWERGVGRLSGSRPPGAPLLEVHLQEGACAAAGLCARESAVAGWAPRVREPPRAPLGGQSQNRPQRAASSDRCCPAVAGARLDNGPNRNPDSLGVSSTAAARHDP